MPFLAESMEWTGHFWLPDEPDKRVPGVLVWTPTEGLVLSLIGGFEDRIIEHPSPGVSALKGRIRHWPVVHGLAENKIITLLDCDNAGSKSSGLGFGPIARPWTTGQ